MQPLQVTFNPRALGLHEVPPLPLVLTPSLPAYLFAANSTPSPAITMKLAQSCQNSVLQSLTFVGDGIGGGATGEVREGVGMTGATRGVWAGVLGSLLLISPPEAEAEPEGPGVPLEAAELVVRVGCKTPWPRRKSEEPLVRDFTLSPPSAPAFPQLCTVLVLLTCRRIPYWDTTPVLSSTGQTQGVSPVASPSRRLAGVPHHQ